LREKLIFFEDKIIDDLDSIKINFVEEESFSENIKEIKNFLIEIKKNNKDSYLNLRDKIISCENQLRNLNDLNENIQNRFRSIYFERSTELTVEDLIGKLNGIGNVFLFVNYKKFYFFCVFKRKI
jgi:hypothetical protein